ncbi:hypothetical protein BC332_29864 [Capsicum chinense]|nr:hypothetical protein BC332_29864 [Capsicum chinense]
MVEDDFTFIPLPNVDTKILIKVIKFIKKRAEKIEESNEEEVKKFYKDFVKKTLNELFVLIWAATYLHIRSLMDLLCYSIANILQDKTPEAIRKIFNIPCDFTPDEERKIIEDNKWVHRE